MTLYITGDPPCCKTDDMPDKMADHMIYHMAQYIPDYMENVITKDTQNSEIQGVP